MKILGLQRTTLVDYPGKVACTIFLFGCNFRCGFCYNPLLVLGGDSEIFSESYILEFLERRRGKLDAVCVTGGEPLMTLDVGFLKKIKAMGYLVKIDTNGSFPDKLKELIDEGLIDYIAMDVKSSRANYSNVVGVDVNIEKVEKSMKIIYDFGKYEFRTTILNKFHDESVVEEMGRWLNDVCGGKPKNLFLQGFKSGHEMIDKSLVTELDVREEYLEKLKAVAVEYFEKVDIRV